jgi:hypothetical protein
MSNQKLPNGRSSYIYAPNGQLIQRPDHGYVFTDYKGDKHVWDDGMSKWAIDLEESRYPLTFDDFRGIPSMVEKKCECGSEKAGVYGHSHWCPKYE